MKLHLGRGEKRLIGYINIDIVPSDSAVDIVADITKSETFKNITPNSVDEIFMQAVFEHLWPEEQLPALKLWRSLLKPGGSLIIQYIPDFERIAKAYISKEPGTARNLPPYCPFFDIANVRRYTHGLGTKEIIHQFHKDIFDKDKIEGLLKEAGFKEIEIKNVYYEDEPIDVNLNIRATK